jgi:peptide/nickel transport system permease protein
VIVRIAQMVPVLFGISLAMFVLVRVVPGDPAQVALGLYATPETVAELRMHWGLDQPIYAQYGIFLQQILKGDLGYSYFYGQTALSLVLERLTPELFLVGYAIAITVLISVPLAIWSSLSRGGLADALVRLLIVLGQSMPAYWVGMLLLLLLAIWWPVFPVGGYGPTLGEQLTSLFLPALTLALGLTPVLVRSLRASLIEALEADHVDMARSKGIVETTVFFRHAFRLALIPSVTLLGLHMGQLIGATLIVEFVFAIPGLGQLMLTAISSRDYPTVVAVTLVFAIFVMVVNLLTDLVVALLDPRARAAMVTAQGAPWRPIAVRRCRAGCAGGRCRWSRGR